MESRAASDEWRNGKIRLDRLIPCEFLVFSWAKEGCVTEGGALGPGASRGGRGAPRRTPPMYGPLLCLVFKAKGNKTQAETQGVRQGCTCPQGPLAARRSQESTALEGAVPFRCGQVHAWIRGAASPIPETQGVGLAGSFPPPRSCSASALVRAYLGVWNAA